MSKTFSIKIKIYFALIVDDFGIQYVAKADAQHLIAALKQDYEAVTVDWEGTILWHHTKLGLHPTYPCLDMWKRH